MLETPMHPETATFQVGSISREVAHWKSAGRAFINGLTPQRLHAGRSKVVSMSKAYLLGALHDGSETTYTFRICQKYESFVRDIAVMIQSLGFNAWTYREGSDRNLFVVEFSKRVLRGFEISTLEDKRDYAQGYFDAEGSVPLNGSRTYIYFCQKDRNDLEEVKAFLTELGIQCGKTHNPSKKNDPEYWRFFVSSKSYSDFARVIGSRHPIKKTILEMMI
jgi:hypothetical protein